MRSRPQEQERQGPGRRIAYRAQWRPKMSVSASNRIPIFSMTRVDARFSGTA